LLFALAACASCVEPGHERAEWITDGVAASAEVHTTLRADAVPLLREMERRLGAGIARLEPQAAESAIGRLNRATRGELQRVDDLDAFRCLALALAYARASDGAYDPTLGAPAGWRQVALARELRAVRLPESTLALDLGEVGHGCALDWAARVFARPGTRAGVLRLGQAIWAWREPPDSATWRVRVPDPRDPRRSLLTIRVANRALATAGRSGFRAAAATPSSDVRAALALAGSAADAAALAQVLLAAGSLEAARTLERTRGAEALLVVDARGGRPFVLVSAALEGHVEPSAELVSETAADLRFLLPPAPR